MHKWDVWGWIAYVGLWIGALILAIDTGLKGAPEVARHMPDFINSHYWGFLPFVLLSISGVIFLGRSLGLIGNNPTNPPAASDRRPNGMQPPNLASNELLFAPDKADKPPIKVIVTPQGALVRAAWNMPPKQIIGQHYENES